jgi:hypothetical protein
MAERLGFTQLILKPGRVELPVPAVSQQIDERDDLLQLRTSSRAPVGTSVADSVAREAQCPKRRTLFCRGGTTQAR